MEYNNVIKSEPSNDSEIPDEELLMAIKTEPEAIEHDETAFLTKKSNLISDRRDEGREKCVDEKKFILRFIEKYESLPALWDVNSEAYSNREEKRKQYEILLKIYNEQYPYGTMDDLKKKINSLRTSFRREKQRLSDCIKNGDVTDESLTPNLFYYNEMEFLVPCTSIIKNTTAPIKETAAKTTKRKPDATEALLEIITKKFCEQKKKNPIINSWAYKLDRMTQEQRILCEKFVEDILFEGQMGTLHRNSLRINGDSNCPISDKLSSRTALAQGSSRSNISSHSDEMPSHSTLNSEKTTPAHDSSSDSISCNNDDMQSPSQISHYFSSFSE